MGDLGAFPHRIYKLGPLSLGFDHRLWYLIFNDHRFKRFLPPGTAILLEILPTGPGAPMTIIKGSQPQEVR